MQRRYLVLAVALLGLGLVELLAVPLADDVVGGPLALNVLTVAAFAGPVALSPRRPLLASSVVHLALGLRALIAAPLELYVPLFAALTTTWALGSYGRVRDAVLAAPVVAAGLAVADLRGTGGDATPDAVATLVLLAAVWGIARVVGLRLGSSTAALEQSRALDARRAVAEAEAVAAERRRIGRELHDAVSHSLSMITMQAGGAQEVLDSDPERVRDSLQHIEQAARAGLGEMRQLLGLLDDEAPPGLARLPELLARARHAGLDVQWSCPRPLGGLPGPVDATAYRVLQEALTNAARHGGRCRAQVVVEQMGADLRLCVTNDLGPGGVGRGHTGPGTGQGLVGMRGRVEGFGGRMQTTSGPESFALSVTLPVTPAR